MSSVTSTPYEWLKKIPLDLVQLDEIPLFGRMSPFPMEKFCAHLAKTFGLKSVKIDLSEFQWREQHDLFSGIGSSIETHCLTLQKFDGKLFWAMSEQDVKRLMSRLLLQGKHLIEILEKDYEAGFYRFLSIEILDAIVKMKWDPNILPQMAAEKAEPDSPMLAMDASLTIDDEIFVGRILISPVLRKSLKEFYIKQSSKEAFIPPLSQKLELTVHLEAGTASMSQNDWAAVKPGDFVLLDQCSLQPGEEKGRVMLTIGGKPFFRGRIKDGNIKILEHPLYYEVNEAMVPRNPANEDEEEDEDLDEDLDEDFDEVDEEEEEESEVEEEEDFEEVEEEEAEEIEESEIEKNEEAAKVAAKAPTAPPPVPGQPQPPPKEVAKIVTPQEIPLSVVVEVGRLQMTVQSLLEMKPGNLLELNIHPESGVDLVVNGSRIGKGELLQIGEVLGVRVLEIG